MLSLTFSLRKFLAASAALVFCSGVSLVWAEHVDPAPMADEVIKSLVEGRLSPLDPLPEMLSAHLDEASALLKDVENTAATTDSGRESKLASKRMLLSAKRAELDNVHADVSARLLATRHQIEQFGLTDKLQYWDDLIAKVEDRFKRVDDALEKVRSAKDAPGIAKSLSAARTELKVLHDDVKTRNMDIPASPGPGWRTETPQPKAKQKSTFKMPEYMSYNNRALGNNIYAALGNTLLAPLPPTLPADAPTNCNILAANDPSLAATQDVQLTQEIKDLAASLNYSPAKIYQYVYQNIRFEPYYGSLKGAMGTLYAKAGSATDQASLLIALLRASNTPARFVKGNIQLLDPVPDALGGRAAHWVGAKSYAAAAAIFSQGQNPSAGTITNASAQATGISLTHVWVEACVPYSHYRGTQQDTSGSRWIPLDPSFKDISYQPGIVLNGAFDYTNFLSKRNNALPNEYYASQLLPAIQGAGVAPYNTNNTLADVPYAGILNPLTVDVLPTSTPYEVADFLPWAGTTSPEIADLPDSHRYKLTVTVKQGTGTQLLTTTLSMPQTVLGRLTLSYQGATAANQTALANWQNDGTLLSATPTPTPCNVINVVPVLKGLVNGQEGTTIATGPVGSPVDLCTVNNQLTLSVSLAELLNPTLNSVTYTNINAASYHALQAYAFQASDRLLTERAALLLANVKANANPNANLDATEGEFLHLVGLKYMRYASDDRKRIAQLDGGSGDSGNHIGLMSSAMKVVYLFDLPFEVARTGFVADWLGMRDRSVDLTTGQSVWKSILLSGYDASALEYYVWQENTRMDAISTVRGFQYANESGIPSVTMIGPANWATDSANLCTVVSVACPNSATLYPAAILSYIQADYAAGYTVTLPKTMIQYGDWKGAVYLSTLNNTAIGQPSYFKFMIGGYNGGYTVRPIGQVGPGGVPLATYNATNNTGYVTPNPALVNAATGLPVVTNTGALNNGFDPKFTVIDGEANVANGNMFRVEKDIDIGGRGGLPLVFERAYNSRNPQNGPLGYGWTHSFNQFLTFKDDNANSAVDAGDSDTLTSSVGWTDGTGAEKLFQVSGTATGVAIGSSFTRLPGTYATLTRNANGTYSVVEKDGMTYTFESIAGTINQKARLLSVNDRNGNTLTLTYATACNNNLCSVKDSLNRTLSFTYNADSPINHLTQMTDWTGRQYQYAYTDTFANLNSYANPLAVAGKQPPVTYQYFSVADGPYLNHALKHYTLPRGNGMSYEYYATGKLFRRTDALGYTRTYSYNDFRRENVETTERGGTRRYFFDQFGNTTQFIEENGAIHNYAYDILVPANVYNRISKQDPEGYTTQYVYDALGNITQVTRPSGSTLAYANFTPFNQPGKVKDANGNYTVFKYDAKGNLTDEIRLSKTYCTTNNCATLNPASYVPAATDMVAWRVNGYDAYGNRLSTKRVSNFAAQVASPTAISATGPLITRTYDTNNLYPISIARSGKKNSDVTPTTQSAPLAYDALGRQTSGIDADWHPTQYSYDTADHLIKGSDALGNLRSYQYDANDNPSGERLDIAGSLLDSRSVGYDLDDRKQSSTDAGGNITAYQYDAAGNVTLVTNPDAYTLNLEYDPSNHETRRYDAMNHAVTRSVDAEGKPRIVTDPNGNAITTSYYDATGDGRLKTISDAGNHQTSLVYDPNGNPTAVTVTGSDNLTTRSTSTFFDELDRPVRIVGPQYTDASLGAIRPVTKYLYDALGNRTQVLAGYTTDATGSNTALDVLKLQTTVAWDDFGRKIKETDPLNQAWSYSYDTNNNLVTAIDPLLQTTTLTWGYGHQLLSLRDQLGNTTRYTRNPLGQVTVAQAPGITYTYAYDLSHRKISATDSRANKTLSYGYSPGGLLNYLQDNDNNRTDYLYDKVGRLNGIWAPNYDYVSFDYDPGGRLLEKWFPNGIDAQYSYNPDNTLASLANKAGSTIISNHVYSYDPLGNRSTQAETVAATTTSYSYAYDNLNRLIQVQNGTAAQQENYTYDPLDNRLSKSIGATTPSITAYVYDNANQLKEIHQNNATGPLLASLTYDADGNLKNRSDTGLSLNYDPLNRLTQATLGGQTQSYIYDDQGRRISKTAAGITSNYLYNGSDIVAEYSNTWGLPTAQYTNGRRIDDAIIRATATTAQYYHQDGLGSVVGVTNNLGTTDATQRFDAWGNKLASTGATPHYGYTGREPDETGLIYYRARYYDPTLGRFTQRDPIGLRGGKNRYAYVDDNPTNFIDPMGLVLQAVSLPGTGGQMKTFYFDSSIANNVVNFVTEARAAGIEITVNVGFRTTAEQTALYDNNPYGNPTAPPNTSRHESGFAVDLNGASLKVLDPISRVQLENIALQNGLSPLDGGSYPGKLDPPHFEANPESNGYKNRNEAIKENQADYKSLKGQKTDNGVHGGGGSVGGLPGVAIGIAATYAGNQN